jgi:hypothetical protein
MSRGAMPLQFHVSIEGMKIWSASSEKYSFVISFETPAGPGFRGRLGYLATWRSAHGKTGAINIGGSPFRTFEEAEDACNRMLSDLADTDGTNSRLA